ncbi:sodium:calcium antiporter [Legionella sp. CNM-4043-24]|uniref:sodium:calcium antiporter n=1 Tax=Legionella sp. CNM-4043-24 TaxID=3421646 RepID=UPI00403AA5F9
MTLASLSVSALIAFFLLAAIAVWAAGIYLSDSTDVISTRFKLGEALGGLIFLAIATNLPEIAIVVSASVKQQPGIAIGNILGGIAIQTVVLVLLDGFGLGSRASLTCQAASLQIVLEGLLVICVLLITIMGAQLPQSLVYAHIGPGDLLIVITWLVGLYLINKARSGLPWHEQGRAPHIHPPVKKKYQQWSTTKSVLVFCLAALITLLAGLTLEVTGSLIAAHIGWSGILFGSTILAAITALPEISTGMAAVRMGDYTLALSDIFGGNAFLPVLFLPATLLYGQSVLPMAQNTDIYLASLGALLTVIYICGLIFRPQRQFFNLGIDSLLVLIIYALAVFGLFTILN